MPPFLGFEIQYPPFRRILPGPATFLKFGHERPTKIRLFFSSIWASRAELSALNCSCGCWRMTMLIRLSRAVTLPQKHLSFGRKQRLQTAFRSNFCFARGSGMLFMLIFYFLHYNIFLYFIDAIPRPDNCLPYSGNIR